MHIQLTLLTNNKQEVWLAILEFLRKNDCHLITQNTVEKGDQRIITVELESEEMLTSTDLDLLKKLSNDILFASTKIDTNPGNKNAPPLKPSKEPIETQQSDINSPQQRTHPFITIAIATIAFLGIGIYLITKPDNIPGQITTTEASQPARINEKTILPKKDPVPLTDDIPALANKTATNDEESWRIHIEKLLQSAQKKIDTTNLSKTSIDSAFSQIQEILQLDPNNKAAKRTLKNIVKAYMTLFDQAIATNDIQQAQQYLKTARNILPKNTVIQEAQKRLLTFQTNQSVPPKPNEKEKQITQLLELATADIRALRLSKPKNNNALSRYQQILSLDPNNPDAQQGIKSVASHYIRLAKKAISNQRWNRAEAYLRQASELNPDKQLSTLYQQKISTAKAKYTLKNIEDQQVPRAVQNIAETDFNPASSVFDYNQSVQVEKLSEKTKPINPIKFQSVQSKNTEKNKSKITLNNKQTHNSATKITSNQIVVIVHPSNPLSNISSKLLKKIYKGQIVNWSSGKKVVVVNQALDSTSRTAFYAKILNTTPETTFKNSDQYFGTTELSAFKTQVKKSDQTVKKIIRRNKKSIGYILLKNIDNSVKQLNIDGLEPLSNGYILQQ